MESCDDIHKSVQFISSDDGGGVCKRVLTLCSLVPDNTQRTPDAVGQIRHKATGFAGESAAGAALQFTPLPIKILMQ